MKFHLRSFRNSEHIEEKGDGPFHGLGNINLVSDPVDLTTCSQGELLLFCIFQKGSR